MRVEVKLLNAINIKSLNKKNIGKIFTIFGWINKIRNHGKVLFIDLRDYTGIIQVIFDKKEKLENEKFSIESAVKIIGKLSLRPVSNYNVDLTTGSMEILSKKIIVLNVSQELPFEINNKNIDLTNEELRLKYRYLDLRRQKMTFNLKLRSQVNHVLRNLLHSKDFIEIETPTLTKSTPEGARDFVVPSRLVKHAWYALPQSPQIFKQFLQASCFSRYYQIARCYRDEDHRIDRQPEFTQLDIEASFVDKKYIMSLSNLLISKVLNLINIKISLPIVKIKYDDAIEKYGTDKPDLRFDLKIFNLTEILEKNYEGKFKHHLYCFFFPNVKVENRLKLVKNWKKWFLDNHNIVIDINILSLRQLISKFDKNLSNTKLIKQLIKLINCKLDDDILTICYINKLEMNIMGNFREKIAKDIYGKRFPIQWSLLWIIDAPLFKRKNKYPFNLTSMHHPFTLPKSFDTLNKNYTLNKHLEKCLGESYDLICNGEEIAGGSMRIYDRKLQEIIFSIIGFNRKLMYEKFGFFLKAFNYGMPPHGGIAFGLDRIIALLCKEKSIRDVIAFPKSGNGNDLLTGSPTLITDEQLKILNL